MYQWLRPFLFSLPAERSHELTLKLLAVYGRLASERALAPPVVQAKTVMNLNFPNPVGLAAGLDKDAVCIDGLGALGFGFIEVGTVTPEPQFGNPRPRLFRLPEHEAIINRMGFNGKGVKAALKGLAQRRYSGVLGVNIGKNKITEGAAVLDDYSRCLAAVYAYADYVNINVSSPNTPGLRQLQSDALLNSLLARLNEDRKALAQVHGKHLPFVMKVSPDLKLEALDRLVDQLLGAGFEGIAATNTTTARPLHLKPLLSANMETGGLSGAPLHEQALAVVCRIRERAQGDLAIIGMGGIVDASTAEHFFDAGADLVQLYSGLIYRGPGLPRRVLRALASAKKRSAE